MLLLLTISFFYLTPRAIVKALDLMKMDMVNFTLTTLKPHLMQQSAEYERQKFQEFLEKQPSEERLGFVRFQNIKYVWLGVCSNDFLQLYFQMPWTSLRSGFETQRKTCERMGPVPRLQHCPLHRCPLTASITTPSYGFSSGTMPLRPSQRLVRVSCTTILF